MTLNSCKCQVSTTPKNENSTRGSREHLIKELTFLVLQGKSDNSNCTRVSEPGRKLNTKQQYCALS